MTEKARKGKKIFLFFCYATVPPELFCVPKNATSLFLGSAQPNFKNYAAPDPQIDWTVRYHSLHICQVLILHLWHQASPIAQHKCGGNDAAKRVVGPLPTQMQIFC